MMVNQFNNNIPPWQSTVPGQMPWLDPHAVGGPIPFSQASYGQNNIALPPSVQTPTISATNLPPQDPFNQTYLSFPATNNTPLVSSGIPPRQIGSILGNPFELQPSSAHQTIGGNVQPIVSGLTQTVQYPLQSDAIPTPKSSYFTSPSLTQLPPNSLSCFDNARPEHQKKRSSFEMEDDQTASNAPPTKQQLSESKLFKRFGTLQLDGDRRVGPGEQEDTDSDSSDDSIGKGGGSAQDRKNFNRYVYLLFKDKKSNNLFNDATTNAMDRLFRDEREKLSKAVILWSPPLKDTLAGSMNQDDDTDDGDEFHYNDHRDFLKKPSDDDEDSIIITEVEDDVPIADACQNDGDDVMQD